MIYFHHSVQEIQQSETRVELRVYNVMQTLLMWEVIEKNHLHNKNQPDALSFLIYSNNYPLHVSIRLTVHH